ncbi:MAG: DUF1648 domain-containing protein [Oscillospiraceae bacterium]|jgi:uncharacterized membrane protein|nr:DUF1648 domain-containing protein [Oscillospiraceae bacterium]
MKWKKMIPFVLSFVPLLIVLVVLPNVPSEIPLHFDADGNADRFGGKYELLIVPIITILVQFYWGFMEKVFITDEVKNKAAAKVALFCGNIVVTLAFVAVTIWLLNAVT